MQLTLAPPPDSLTDLELTSGHWRTLRQPPMWVFRLLAVPAGAVVAFCILRAWGRFAPRVELQFAPAWQVFGAATTVLLAGAVLQLCAHPGFGLTRNSVLGFWPSRVLPYTTYLEKVSKARSLVMLLLPFLVLSVAPLLAASVFRLQSGWLVFVSGVAAVSHGAHVLLAVSSAIQLPSDALVAGRGFQTFWRAP
jgi:hypothetical protein